MKHITFDRIITVILLLVCIALASVVGYRYLGTGSSSQDPMAMGMEGGPMPSSTQSEAVNVSVVEVTRGVFTKSSTMGAELAGSRDTVSIASTVSGQITELFVSEGDEIALGDPIATIDPSTAGSKYKSQTLTSPLSGTVYELPSYLGQQISSGATLVTLGMTGDLEITASISERFLSTLTEGLQATFTTSAWPEENFTATVASISPQVNTSNRTVDVILTINESDERLKEGMFVKLTLITDQQDNVLVIPSDAITTYLGEPVVYIVEDGAAKRVPVVTGDSDNSQSVVVSGLEGGEQLITAGSVVDGTVVSVIGEAL